jgi:hypothetical protein
MMLSLVLLPTFATANSVFGGYDVQTANVALAGVVEDIASIGGNVPSAFPAAKTTYTKTTDPSLQKFAKASGADYSAGATHIAFASLWPTTGTTMWDDLVVKSLDNTLGTAQTGDDLDDFRKYGVNKGVLGACIFEALNLLEAALAAPAGTTAQDHVDKAWAVYYGSKDGGAKSAAEVTKKREDPDDFGSGSLLVFSRLHFAFKQARDALAATGGSADAAADAVKSIKKMIILTFARATIKYSHKRKTASAYNAGAHMEGDAYYRIFAGVALSFLANDAAAKTKIDAISAKMAYTLAEADLTATTDHCEVKKMVEAMYPQLGLDCAQVGVMPNLATCPAAETCWANMGGEKYVYMPLSDVYSIALITKDVATMTTKSKDAGDMPGATEIYANGGVSSLKLKDIATADHGTDTYFKAYKDNFGANSFDVAIAPALAGTGYVSSKSAAFKGYVVAKCGITVLNMKTMTLLEDAKAAAAAGKQTYAADGAGFLWDSAYATFAEVDSAAKSVGGYTGGVVPKRDKDFVTENPTPNTANVMVKDVVLKQFQEGKTALMASPFVPANVDTAIAEIKRLVGITFARATIKYSSKLKAASDGEYSDTNHPEGFCYWRGMAGYYAAKTGDTTTVDEIDKALSLTKVGTDFVMPAAHCDVKKKMESLYPKLGITCAEVGGMPGLHTCETTCAANVAAAEAAAAAAAATQSRAPLAAVGALVTAFILA